MEEEKIEQELTEENKSSQEVSDDVSVDKKSKKEKKDLIKNLQDEVKDWKDKYYRVYADMDNLRKQYQKDYLNLAKYQSQTIVEKILPSLDIFAMVIGSADNLSPEVKNYVMGFDVVYRQMLQALESEGVSEIPCAIGDKFNHDIHFAMDTTEVDDENQIDKIVKIYQKGYKLHDRLIRATTVSVGAKKVVKNENKQEQEAQA